MQFGNLVSLIQKKAVEATVELDNFATMDTRRSSLMEFGIDSSKEIMPSGFELCKGIQLTLD